VINSSFEQAVQLTHTLYNFAALHLIAEKKNGTWVNRYTSLTYGREEDLRSVPPKLGAKSEEGGGSTFLCLRQRLPREEAEQFVSGAVRGSASIGTYTVVYDIEPAITGFRPAHTLGNLAEGSMWNSSGWSREYIGSAKEVGSHPLTRSTAWRIEEGLGFLRKAIWLPIPLQQHPEKLGDLDEFWPTPIDFEVRRANGAIVIEIAHDILKPEDNHLTISGVLIQNDLICGHVHFKGKGPHELPIDPDAIDLVLCVNGVPFDAKANRFLSRISMHVAVDSGDRTPYIVPESGGRPEMTFQVGTAELKEQVVGKPPIASVRHNAWVIGRIFRNKQRSHDSERFYDPVLSSDAVQRAFDDLRQLGTNERRPRVLIADAYALDERALYAIGTIAARLGSVASIDIVTEFKSGNLDAPLGTRKWSFANMWKAWISGISGGRARAYKRQEIEQRAFDTANRVAGQLKVRFRFYRAERLHDRFLVIGERLWHVGPSFNRIGEEISAIVEMTDERIKCQVLESLAGFTAGPLLKEANP
jgi:hypothetical protein